MASWWDRVGGDVSNWSNDFGGELKTALTDVGHFIENQNVPGSQAPGNEKGTTFGQAVDQIGQRFGQKKTDPGRPSATQTTLDQLNALISDPQYTAVAGTGAAALAGQIGKLLSTLPYNVANQWISKNSGKGGVLSNTPLGTAVTNYMQTGGAPSQATNKPIWDPLALQTMWHDVFGPAFNQASQIAGSVGPGYLNSMQQAIAGSNASPQAKQQMLGNAQATANLIQQTGKAATSQAATQIPFDTLIAQLQQASGTAQLAQGSAEKAIAYGQAAPFLGGAGTSGLGGGTGISPITAGGYLNSALTGTQTSNPLSPNIPGYTRNIP
jgi:hypothetical protein